MSPARAHFCHRLHIAIVSGKCEAVCFVRQWLRDAGCPVEGLHFDPKLVTRGLIVDKTLGNLLKARTHLGTPLQGEITLDRPHHCPLLRTSMTQHGRSARQQLCLLKQGVRTRLRLALRSCHPVPQALLLSQGCVQGRRRNTTRRRG